MKNKLLYCCLGGILLPMLLSCRYRMPDKEGEEISEAARDSLACLYEHHYTRDANLEVGVDSVDLAVLPLKDAYCRLYRDDRVVVAEFAVHPADTVDTVWVKLAHTQEMQGWIRESELKETFVPADSISQFIHFFSNTHAAYSVAVVGVFVGVWLLHVLRKRRLRTVFIDDIDSAYPLLLCLLLAFCATLYESMQVFVPETWEHFYFNPTLSPFQVPPVLAAFLASLWLFVVVFLAVLDVVFKQLPVGAALLYLLGLVACCIFCYFFFILTTRIYVSYLFLAAFAFIFVRKVRASLRATRYSCGHCGRKLRSKGICPYCGALNE